MNRPPAHERTLPREARIADTDVEQALADVCDPSVRSELTGLLHQDLGRPRLLSVDGLLAGMQICADRHDGQVLLDRTTAILHWAISPGMRERFGIPERPDDAHGFEAGYAVVRRLFHRLVDAMDPSPLPKNHRLDKATARRLQAAADPAALQQHAALLLRTGNAVVDASLTRLRLHLDAHWDGSTALDATPVRTYSRGLRTTGPDLATDPDAGWYVREGDHRDPDTLPAPNPKKNSKRKRTAAKAMFGYDATLAIARNPHRDGTPRPDGTADPRVPPAVVTGFTLDRPGHAPGPNAIRVLADVRRRGHPAGFLAGDRAYNNTAPDDFQLPARALGYRLVFDYRQDQLGLQAGTAGAQLIEGTWYCPALPKALVTATSDLHSEAIDQETWIRRIAARLPFQLVPKQHPEHEGHQRMSCPAAAGRVQCLLKASSLGRDPRLPLADPKPSPAGPAKICAQQSITIPPEAGAQHHQALPYGSPDWQRVYFRLRNSVEGFNGFAKDPLHEAIEQAGTRRIRGIAAQTLLLAFQLAHANRRKIDRWLATIPPDGHPPRRRPTRRRPTRPLGIWTPAGHLTSQ
ncbi:hypothetical protein FGW37_29960 [Streptomyces rectiverticillatus]|uniref:hypothetical protein n=1 Tax=Streptomyces rectiverticillatus TaxID=173860 RepID=UPI0015C34D62|nr:hypothetical protein [Streptomyces rectiverticillatus]QLE75260.1 hypothetical protein FGW37_29960 [Streptomyces rectiverticillatus]